MFEMKWQVLCLCIIEGEKEAQIKILTVLEKVQGRLLQTSLPPDSGGGGSVLYQ